MEAMYEILASTLMLLLLASPAPAEVTPVSVPDDSSSVVVSIAISSGVLAPDAFPVAGRDCGDLLDELQESERFAGQIRTTYEPPVDRGLCFNLEGKQARVAVVCCAPRSRP